MRDCPAIERRLLLGSAGLIVSFAGLGCTVGTGDSQSTGKGEGAPIGDTDGCVGTAVVAPKRFVRLSEHQLYGAYSSLFGSSAAAFITEDEAPPSSLEREFPPISAEIGVSEGFFALIDRLAQSAMRYVARNAETLTSCGATPSDAACVQQFLLAFAETAFRHPLGTEERNAISGRFWAEMNAAGASPADALGFGVYGVLSSPSFVYRTELGSDVTSEGGLAPYELATALALFLTDRPPDEELLALAASNELRAPDQVRAQATRLLATPEARQNLELALVQYFSLGKANTAILNPEATPGLSLTRGLQASIFHEGELFMKNVLWSGPLDALLTARTTWTSAEIATGIYGVAPPSDVDADGFGLVELPADRSGLLTLSTFLLAGARSTGTSPVARGLAVNGSIVCGVNPTFPESVNPETGARGRDPEVAAAIEELADESELVKAEYRAETPKCAGCHLQFDAYGMVLEPYDAVGRLRTADLEGRPIDATWTTTTLPESVGGAMVTNAAETAQALVASGALERCLAMNFINFALTEVSGGGANNTDLGRAPQTGSCAVKSVIDRFATTDRSFPSLVREIAASEAFRMRSRRR